MQTWEKIKKNPSLIKNYLIREKVIDSIRTFFKKQNFLEVQTPILVPVPSCEPNLEVFKTILQTHKGQERDAYLIMSPEYSIKKLLSAGIGNCFEITKCFRNKEEVSSVHNPEFTMLEWYRTRASYIDIMKDFEDLFVHIVKATNPETNLSQWRYLGKLYDITPPWIRISVSEAFQKYAGIDNATLISEKGLIESAKKKNFQVSAKTTWEEIFYQIIFNEIEPRINKTHRPYFLYDYPVSQASLSKKKIENPDFAERFEVFLAGVELGNCFSELIDSHEQKARFQKELKERQMAGKTQYALDNELIRALKSGMPEVAGIAVGVDRLIMLAGNFKSISETMFFPAKELFDLNES